MRDPQIVVRRSIVLTKADDGSVEGWLEDNFHHFGVMVQHEHGRVCAVRSATLRYPWTTCSEAGHPLQALVGEALESRVSDLAARLPKRLQCTHLFELALMAVAHAADGGGVRRYDMVVRNDRRTPDQFDAALLVNGDEVLRVEVTGSTITAPTGLHGRDLYQGFSGWLQTLDREEAERMWLMRRACWLAAGLSRFKPSTTADGVGLAAVCHSFQPGQRFRAMQMPDARIDAGDPTVQLLRRKAPLV